MQLNRVKNDEQAQGGIKESDAHICDNESKREGELKDKE